MKIYRAPSQTPSYHCTFEFTVDFPHSGHFCFLGCVVQTSGISTEPLNLYI